MLFCLLSWGLAVVQDPNTNIPLDAVEERIRQDQPFTLMAHKPNYLLFASYNSSSYNAAPFKEEFSDPNYSLKDIEAKFQLSIKFPLLVDMANDTFDIYAAYTNRSFWQVYNEAESAPFRETNHEPEIWFNFTRTGNYGDSPMVKTFSAQYISPMVVTVFFHEAGTEFTHNFPLNSEILR